ncbi:MAG TPA: ATP-binding protein [Polyangiaceae bacterium]|nr:ATP-binding protein [Polyangiaceae bacterium]
MSAPPLRVLMVEDSPTDAKLVVHALRGMGRTIEFARVEDEGSMRAALIAGTWDLIVSDWSLPRFSALGALAVACQINHDVPFIVVSGTIDETCEEKAMRAGADDFLLKGKLARLVPAVERGLRESEGRRCRVRTEEGADPSSLDAAREDAAARCQSAIRAVDLAKQGLMFSRHQTIEPQILDLNAVIASMDRMLLRLVREDVKLTRVVGYALGNVKADRGNLEQIIVNLVMNACEAMPTGGRLTIETGNVTLDVEYERSHVGTKAGRYVMLAVTDTGMGMDQATQARMFEPFFTTKERGQGSGLGLATVLGIVHHDGGCIWVCSEPLVGTTVKLYLPFVNATQ